MDGAAIVALQSANMCMLVYVRVYVRASTSEWGTSAASFVLPLLRSINDCRKHCPHVWLPRVQVMEGNRTSV